MNDVADLRLLASLDRACDCGVDGPIYAPLHEGPCQHDAARQKIANLGGWKGISIQQAAEITRLRAELAEARGSAQSAHAVCFAAGISRGHFAEISTRPYRRLEGRGTCRARKP